MPETMTTTIYKFNELSQEAKAKARDWWKEGMNFDWWDAVYEDAFAIGDILGICIAEKKDHNTAIYFSGFCSQGDGASFDGRYSYAKKSRKKIRAYAPKDKVLHAIADKLFEVQGKVIYSASASMQLRGRYCHEYCMDVDVNCDERYLQTVFDDVENKVTEYMRDFARWIYRQLEKEYTYITSDAAVDDTIECNDYMFAEDGSRSVVIQ